MKPMEVIMLHLDTSLFPSTGWLNREVAAFPLSSRRITVKSTQGNYQRFIYLAAELFGL